jgi:hypothetical protein
MTCAPLIPRSRGREPNQVTRSCCRESGRWRLPGSNGPISELHSCMVGTRFRGEKRGNLTTIRIFFSIGCRNLARFAVLRSDVGRNRDSRDSRPLDLQRLRPFQEVTVILSQDALDQIADRIERAYRRNYPGWVASGLTPGVWSSAAARLLEIPAEFASYPVDPELFVAVQVRSRFSPDPWSELTQRRSIVRYLKALKRIATQLRDDLNAEVQRAECRMIRGLSLDVVLETEGHRISPLACYILAHRAGRSDLSLKYRASAERQHQSCPMYRLASRSLLPSHAYPSTDLDSNRSLRGREIAAFSLN